MCFRWFDNNFIIPDTRAERNALMERVYPSLKQFCQERGHEFEIVDMRWGVRDQSTEDHLTTQLCIKELQKCQKLSTGPNFIASVNLLVDVVSNFF